MADKRISELQELPAADVVASIDVLPIADISASETRKIKVSSLGTAAIAGVADGAISGSKLENGTVTGDKLADGTVTGSKVANDTLTADNIAPNAIGASELANGAVDTDALQGSAVTGAKIADSAVGRGIDKQAEVVGHEQEYFPGAPASFAGVTVDEYGHVSALASSIPPTDLPIATDAVNGVSHYPANSGLSISGAGAVGHTNTVLPATKPKVTYDANGHVTNGADLDPSDLPLATASDVGAVKVVGPTLSVDGTGALIHASSGVIPGTYTKVTVNEDGHATAGLNLEASDIPDLSYDQLTSGSIGPGYLGEGVVTAENMADYSTSYMQDANPGEGDYLGQMWYSPETAQLSIYARGSNGLQWLPVGFGRLAQENLRWGGLVNADTGLITVLTDIGQSAGLTVGMAPPASTDALGGLYLVVDTSGNSIGVLPGTAFDSQDWLLCVNEAQGWTKIDSSSGGGGGGGGGSSTLAGLLDTEITTPQDGDLLVYNSGDGKWVNGPLAVIEGGSF